MSKTQASITTALIAIIGQATTFIPGLAPEKQQLVSTASLVIAAVFGLIHIAHLLATSKITPTQLEHDAEAALTAAVSTLDLNAIAKNVETQGAAAIPELVRAEIAKLLSTAAAAAPPPAPDAATPPA